MLTRFCRFRLRYLPAHGFAAPAGNGAQAEAVRSAPNKTNPEFLGMALPPSGKWVRRGNGKGTDVMDSAS